MIDWKKPLQIVGLDKNPVPCKVLSVTLKSDKYVVETDAGMVYAAFKRTGFIQGQLGHIRVENPPEPWKQAFDSWGGVNDREVSVMAKTFQVGFEAGITYALGTVK